MLCRIALWSSLGNTSDSFMAIIRHFEVARETGEMVVEVHCETVLRKAFSTWRQIGPPKQSHNAL